MSAMLKPDTVLHERYQIVRMIGKGGMGAVYKAVDYRLKSTVALKQTLLLGENTDAAFEREAQLLAHLHHQGLPKVTDYFTDSQGQFLVMEYFEGDDLSIRLKLQAAPFPVKDVLDWADQVLQVLEYLHQQNPPVVHRDIKPQNLKRTTDGHIVLLDFGLAKGLLTQDMTAPSLFGFTPQYAPPEQVEGSGTEPRSDLYALAATLHHLLTYRIPPKTLIRIAALRNQQPDPLLPAHELNPDIPVVVSMVLQQALAMNIEDRPSGATALREALRLSSTPGRARPTVVLRQLPDDDLSTIKRPPNVTEQDGGYQNKAAKSGAARENAQNLPKSGETSALPGSYRFSNRVLHDYGLYVLLIALLVFVLTGYLVKALVFDPAFAPMPEGWNIAVAGIGVANHQDGFAEKSDEGKGLSELIVLALQDQADHIKGWRDVGFITGDSEQRAAQAEEIARKTNADVVIYGIMIPTTPGRARFAPSFYINEESKSASAYGAEILGSEQFGAPVDFVLDTDQGSVNNAINGRLDILKGFLNGLQNYTAEDFEQAHQEFQTVLERVDIQKNAETAAVIYEFLGALEIEQGPERYNQAIEYLTNAWRHWPEYARPYLSKGAILYQYALSSFGLAVEKSVALEQNGPFTSLSDSMRCFEPAEIPRMTGKDYLNLSLRCYEESRDASGQTPTMDMQPKIALSVGNIYLTLSDQTDEDHWKEASESFSEVITIYESSNDQRKERMRRLAAHAYAKRGLITICYPDCGDPDPKTGQEYEQAVEDYKHALELLQSPQGCRQDMNRCYPSDVPYIETYQEQLQVLEQHLERDETSALDF
jgi:serine/threonine protein kinase/tetratricopeptide (TPR) repeat protein